MTRALLTIIVFALVAQLAPGASPAGLHTDGVAPAPGDRAAAGPAPTGSHDAHATALAAAPGGMCAAPASDACGGVAGAGRSGRSRVLRGRSLRRAAASPGASRTREAVSLPRID
jgi:hypothetical protein